MRQVDRTFMGRVKRIVAKEVPIYDNLRPDPATGKRDCNQTRWIKEQARAALIIRITNNIKKFDAGYV